ncbi:FAD-dependent oxidoreductase, partial [Planctomycetota bacterium]
MPIDSKLEGVVYDASHDLIVIGGGIGGVCAAIAAARHGCTTALVQDRPVLGGNSSSEVRVNMGGADAHNSRRHARESGIVEELRLDDRVRNHEPVSNGRINWIWDHVLLDAVRREPALTLYLNTSARQAIMGDETTIEGVIAYQCSTYRTLHLRGHHA